jgi:hypothetical protein
MADAPTAVVVNWNGTGSVTGSTTAGAAATYNFSTAGNGVAGSFTVVDLNDNPYSYGVDSTNSYINSDVIGGYIYYQATRIGSYSSMYGIAGQVASSVVQVGADGIGEMATGSGNNYAAMVNGTYGATKTSGGYNYQASGTNYFIQTYIGIGAVGASTGNNAFVESTGIGTAKINDMTNQMGGTSLALGLGGGCYTNANALLTGEGRFAVGATGTDAITSALGSYTLGGAGSTLDIAATGTGITYGSGITTTGDGFGTTTLSVIANYGNGATVTDYSLTAR